MVANRTAATGVLLDEVERRAAEDCRFASLPESLVKRAPIGGGPG